MALLTAKDIMESCTIVLLTIVLRIITSCTTEPILSDAFTMLYNIVVLIVFKVLSNIAITVKKLIIIKLAIY